MRVLLTSASFALSYGGPAISVSRLALSLARLGAKVGIWAPDGSAVAVSRGQPETGVKLLKDDLQAALRSFGVPDLLHDSGMWLHHNRSIASLSHQLSIPRIVTLRGMLAPWAMRHKAWKKRIAWFLYQKRDLDAATALHATAVGEAENARILGLRTRIFVVPNGVDIPTISESPNELSDRQNERTALFLGRLHPVKGLPMLLRAWAEAAPAAWKLLIVGPDEAGHLAELLFLQKELALGERVAIQQPVYNHEKEALLASADLVILPSYTENFGMAIAEALAFGVPVITTTGTPWAQLEEKQCGWWIAPEAEALAKTLMEATSLPPKVLKDMGARGRAVISSDYTWNSVGARIAREYEEVLCGRP